MLRLLTIIAATGVLTAGCTSTSLTRHTLNQVNSIEDYRVKAVLDCLADMAHNPNSLPSYGLLANGVTRVQDTGTASSITLWARALEGFSTETLSLTASRVPQGQWTVDPVASYSQIDALRCACRWAIFGPGAACRECADILEDPVVYYSPQEPRFGVADRLRQLPAGWLKVGTSKQVPTNAAHKGHTGSTWIWILPEYKWCFSEFMLICHDIATIDPNQAVFSPPLLITITRNIPLPLLPACRGVVDPNLAKQQHKKPDPSGSLAFVETRVIRPEYKDCINKLVSNAARCGLDVALSENDWLACTYPYTGTRTAVKPGAPTSISAGESITAQQLNRGYFIPAHPRVPPPSLPEPLPPSFNNMEEAPPSDRKVPATLPDPQPPTFGVPRDQSRARQREQPQPLPSPTSPDGAQ